MRISARIRHNGKAYPSLRKAQGAARLSPPILRLAAGPGSRARTCPQIGARDLFRPTLDSRSAGRFRAWGHGCGAMVRSGTCQGFACNEAARAVGQSQGSGSEKPRTRRGSHMSGFPVFRDGRCSVGKCRASLNRVRKLAASGGLRVRRPSDSLRHAAEPAHHPKGIPPGRSCAPKTALGQLRP